MMLSRREDFLNGFFVFCLISFFALMPAGSIRAVSGNGLVAYPADSAIENSASESWFLYGLDRGENKRDSFILGNESDEKQTVNVYAADSATDTAGGFVLETAADSKDGVGAWIALDNDTVTLEAGERKTIGFTIAIPQDALGGEISGGIVIQKVPEVAETGGTEADSALAPISIRIYEVVPEVKVEKLGFGSSAVAYDRNTGGYVLRLTVKNEGNVFLEPVLDIRSADLIFASQDENMTQKLAVPAGGEIEVSYPLSRARVGRFELSPVLSFGEGEAESTLRYPRAIYFWATPWDAIRIVMLILLAYILCWILRYVRDRRDSRYYKNYRVVPSENLDDLAEKLGISWKRIVRMNELKPPYQITKGQLIKVIDKQNVLDQPYIKKDASSNRDIKIDVEWENWRTEGFSKKDPEGGSAVKGHKGLYLMLVLAMAVIVGAAVFLQDAAVYPENANIVDTGKENAPNASETTETTDATEKIEDAAPQETVPAAQTETPAAVIEELPTPALTAADRAGVKIEVLNGSGIKGVSSRAAAAFQAQGYAAATGNADRFDYARTLLTCGAGMDERICAEARAILSADYPDTEMSTSDKLASDAIKIILGK